MIMLCSVFLIFFISCETNETNNLEANYSDENNSKATKADNVIEGTIYFEQQSLTAEVDFG